MIEAKLLADANIVSYLFRDSGLAADYRDLIAGRPVGVTMFSLAELHYGIALNRWERSQYQRFDQFLSELSLLPTPPVIAAICGNLRSERERIGQRLDPADAWIAATALWYGIPLRDTRPGSRRHSRTTGVDTAQGLAGARAESGLREWLGFPGVSFEAGHHPS
jgi:tRNA(fMet)-specific endonuclease VapC